MILSQVFKALADPNRLRALGALEGKELCVCQVVELLGLAPSTVSKHMSVLAHAGLIEGNKRGRWMYYRHVREPANASVRMLLDVLPDLLDQETRIRKDALPLEKILALDPEVLCCKQRERMEQGRETLAAEGSVLPVTVNDGSSKPLFGKNIP